MSTEIGAPADQTSCFQSCRFFSRHNRQITEQHELWHAMFVHYVHPPQIMAGWVLLVEGAIWNFFLSETSRAVLDMHIDVQEAAKKCMPHRVGKSIIIC